MIIRSAKGSVLLVAVLFAFVIMLIISGVSYNFKMSSLAIKAVVLREDEASVSDGYLRDLFLSVDVSKYVESYSGSYRFVSESESIAPEFYHNATNVELYKAEPYLESNAIGYQFFYNNVPGSTKDIIFNSLANVNVIQNNSSIYTLDVPYVHIPSMTDAEKTYKLSNDLVLDSELGNVGYLEKQGSFLTISANSSTISVAIPNDISSEYKIAIGWNLQSGRWVLFLAIYDDSHFYTSSTTLRNLVDNTTVADVELSSWEQEVSLPLSNIVLARWYHYNSFSEPTPLVLQKSVEAIGSSYNLNVYRSSYNSTTKIFTAILADSLNLTTDFDITNVHMVIPDHLFTLSAGVPLISQDNILMDFNLSGGYTLGDGTNSFKDTLSAPITGDPSIVRKNPTEIYYSYYDGDTYYQYVYALGAFSHNGISTRTYVGEVVRGVVPKFSAMFVFTDQNVYIQNIENPSLLINKIPTNGSSNYNISRDDADGRIYLMPDMLTCSVSNNCKDNDRVFIDINCATNGDCSAVTELDDIFLSLGRIHQRDVVFRVI